uniref:Uncharacterized protein n=1 Tax=Anguilla anguilla TaxID=7936 RepID=A0A0E9UXW3_ANGAN
MRERIGGSPSSFCIHTRLQAKFEDESFNWNSASGKSHCFTLINAGQ